MKTGLWTAILSLPLLTSAALAEIRYVSLSGGNIPPYTNWDMAATSVGAAVGVADQGDTILVTDGVYNVTAEIMLKRGRTLISVNGMSNTILQSDGGNHRLVYASNAVITGFTMQNAYLGNDYASAMLLFYGSTGSWLTIKHNTNASYGGAVWVMCDSALLDSVIVSNQDVGTVQNYGVGGVFFYDAMTIQRCYLGYNYGRGSGTIEGGGAAEYHYSSRPSLIEDCTFEYNQSAGVGGGLCLQKVGSIIRRCVFKNNIAGRRGGGVSTPGGLFENCVMAGNKSGAEGGGIYMGGGELRNCTIVANRSGTYGGGQYGGNVYNSIIYYNTAGSGGDNYYSGARTYCCTTPYPGGTGNITNEPGLTGISKPRLIATSPCIDAGSIAYASGDTDLFGNPRVWGRNIDIGCNEYYAPGATSPVSVAINAPYTRAVAGFPLSFEALIDGPVIGYRWLWGAGTESINLPVATRAYATPGVYEVTLIASNRSSSSAATTTVHVFSSYTNYVSLSGAHEFPFTNWTLAATTLQDAVAANIPGGFILVATGVYASGYSAVGGGLPSRVALTNAVTMLSVGNPADTLIVGAGPLGTGAVRCAYIGDQSRLIGFTLTNGFTRANWQLAADQLHGGGAYCTFGGAISNCIISGNMAFYDGGGTWGGHLENCTVAGNVAGRNGGGVSDARIRDCQITGNEAANEGGGFYNGAGANCRLIGNVALQDGGGGSRFQMTNGIISGNSARHGGGAVWGDLLHCTIVSNTATESGGGLYWSTIRNGIAYYNQAAVSWANFFNSICLYTCTTPDPENEGCTTNPPLFANLGAGDYRLQIDSPCVDTGWSNNLPSDIEGTPRPLDGNHDGIIAYDMGAFERAGIFYVATNGGNIPPYQTWSNAAREIQSAIDAAGNRDFVVVSNGIYLTGGRPAAGRATTNRVLIEKPLTVYSVNGCTSAVILGRGPLGPAAVRGVYLASNASLCGFTIIGGYTVAESDNPDDLNGGGIWAGPEVTVTQCVVRDCTAAGAGGGGWGGAWLNALLFGNTAASNGGGAWGAEFGFSSLADNTAGVAGGGLAGGLATDSIIFGNQAGGIESNWFDSAMARSCTAPLPPGPGNIAADPLFINATGQDYRPDAASPCVDAVTNEAVLVDLLRVPRPLDGNNDGYAAWDMGAHEFINPTSDTDHDWLNDTNEIYQFGTDPQRADTDGDRQMDGAEVIAGMNPLDPASFFAVLQVTNVGNARARITWPGVNGRLYTLLYSSDPTFSGWTNLAEYTDQPGTDGAMSYTNSVTDTNRLWGVAVRQAP